MIADETKPENFRNERGGDHSHIKGWGIDRDTKNDPTYPMKKRTDEEIEGYTWERPEQQPVNIDVLKSVERPNIPAVFGNTLPPSGLSGVIRRLAFKYSESSYGRWLPLVMADRINVFEGYIDDLKNGIIPNVFAERGWNAEWKHNRKGFIQKAAVAGIAAVGVYLFLTRNKRD